MKSAPIKISATKPNHKNNLSQQVSKPTSSISTLTSSNVKKNTFSQQSSLNQLELKSFNSFSSQNSNKSNLKSLSTSQATKNHKTNSNDTSLHSSSITAPSLKSQESSNNPNDMLLSLSLSNSSQSINLTKTIDQIIGKNSMSLIFSFLTARELLLTTRFVSCQWKSLIEWYLDSRQPLIQNEKLSLESIVNTQMENQESHSTYVRAYKQVSAGHDLVFNLGRKQVEQFYLLKTKSETAKEVRSILHRIIGETLMKNNPQIKKYSAEYYEQLISACKDVSVSEFTKDIELRLAALETRTDIDSLQNESEYISSFRVLLKGYLHLYQQTHGVASQKTRLTCIQEDQRIVRIYERHRQTKGQQQK